MSSTDKDREWMHRALELAGRGRHGTDPNPRVGCVLVRDGTVVGEGFHERAGGPHAEAAALRSAGDAARGASVYTTLEPCAHHGRTPPCADALAEAGVARVVAAHQDPNPEVAGRGFERLRGAGIEVVTGLLEDEARELNRGFITRHERGRPWFTVKVAMSLDGRTALANGDSRWISGEPARNEVQYLRASASAVLTGIGTVLSDDPRLTVRLEGEWRQPARVVLDPSLRCPADARLFEDGGAVFIIAARDDIDRVRALSAAGATVVRLPADGGRIDLAALSEWLADQQFNEVLVEAGATLTGALFQDGLVDELIVYMAPALLGSSARPLLALPPLERMAARRELEFTDVRAVGRDWRITARPARVEA